MILVLLFSFFVLSINIRIKKGELAAIVGEVGAGKSSLLSALLGDMEKLDGRVNILVRICYFTFNLINQDITRRFLLSLFPLIFTFLFTWKFIFAGPNGGVLLSDSVDSECECERERPVWTAVRR